MDIRSTNFPKQNFYKSASNQTQKIVSSIGQSILFITLLLLLLYILYYTYQYYSIPCAQKISLLHYLTNFGVKGFCVGEDTMSKSELSLQEAPLQKKSSLKGASLNLKDEIFQISNQTFTWDEAKCKCESYGARLATKAELTEAYNKGAHWCQYGWLENGEAYYPVQQCELDKRAEAIREYNEILKKHYEDPKKYTYHMVNEARNKMDRHELCGTKSGVQGGKFYNQNVRLGATCFGKKPAGMSVREKEAECEKSDAQKEYEAEEEQNQAAKAKCDGKSSNDRFSSFNPDQWNQNQ
jgi:hypothetical protein